MTGDTGDFDSDNPYDVLGIPRTSDSAHARKTFLEKCKSLHPDKQNKCPGQISNDGQNVFERMKEAYEKIKESEREEKSATSNALEVGEEASDEECGRVAFNGAKYDVAVEFFQKALMKTENACAGGAGVTGVVRRDANEVAKIHANISACFLKMNKPKMALHHADVSFDSSKRTFAKALYRRAEALEKMKEFPRARDALDKMLRLDSSHSDEVHPKLKELAVKQREYEKKLELSEREKEKRKQRGEGQPGTMPQWHPQKPKPQGMDDIDDDNDDDDDDNGNENKYSPEGMKYGDDEEQKENVVYEENSKPMIDGLGLEAIHQMMTLAQIKYEEGKGESGEDNERKEADEKNRALEKTGGDKTKEFSFKRCKMCGNVCNVKMSSCSSCCLPLVDILSFTPVYHLPNEGSKRNNDGDDHSEYEDNDAYASSSSDDEDANIINDGNNDQVLPLSALTATEKQKKSLEALKRRRNERQTVKSGIDYDDVDNNNNKTFWWENDPSFSSLQNLLQHKKGYDPNLQSAYKELKIPLGSGESRVRDAYLNQIVLRHPDAAGSKTKLFKAQEAYETIAKDFWRHDSGASAMREKLLQRKKLQEEEQEVERKIQVVAPIENSIFVSLSVYRDLEAQHTLRSMFKNAKDPSRVFVGVCWQYKTETTTEISPVTGEREKCPCRLHNEVNRVTIRAEQEAAKMKGEDNPESYLLNEVRNLQLEVQEHEDELERKAHSASQIFVNEKEKIWVKNIRETHMNWDSSDGGCYSRHLANRLWGGETHILYVHSKTAFDENWDETLFRELENAKKDNRMESENNNVVLSSHPLGYKIESAPVLDPNTYELDHSIFVYGKRTLPSKEDRDAPAMITAHTFGNYFPHLSASKLHKKPEKSLKSALTSNLFMFGPSEAFIRDAPVDVHAPFLYLGEEISMAIRLFTKNWDVRTPPTVPLLHCSDQRFRRESYMEDRRKGRLLYVSIYDAAYGTPVAVNRRTRLNEYSRRRIFQIICDGEISEEAAGGKVLIPDKYNIGTKRSVKEFEAFSGISVLEKKIAERAKTANCSLESFEKNERKIGYLLPPKNIGGISYTPEHLYNASSSSI